MGHESVPPEIAKTLVGWKKHLNSYTTQGRFNVSRLTDGLTSHFSILLLTLIHLVLFVQAVMASLGITVLATLYFTRGKKEATK